ncbi:hypothetical protein IIC68_02570 [archaeon]|nr:hypothetical protein [archaeon]
MALLKELRGNNNIVVSVNEGFYKDAVLGLNKSFKSKYKKICFVSVARPVTSVIKDLKKENIDPKNYFFIDCVAKERKIKKPLENCVYVESPTSLTKIHIALVKLMREHKISLVFFDSISSLLVYNDDAKAISFLNDLMNDIRDANIKSVFIVMKSDLKNRLVKELEIFADKTVDFNPIYLQELSRKK